MKFTVSLNKNRDFRRLYARGKSAAASSLVVYSRRNGLPGNRLGITVGTKIGRAVKRNLVRRRIKEAYRAIEGGVKTGYDIVVVARGCSPYVKYAKLTDTLKALIEKVVR